MFRKKSFSDELFLTLSSKVQNLTVVSICRDLQVAHKHKNDLGTKQVGVCGCMWEWWEQSGSTLDWPKSVWPNSVLLGQTLETPTLATVGWAKVGHDCDRISQDIAKSVGMAMRNRDTIEKYTSRTVTVSTKKSVVTRRVQQLGKCATTESCGTENARAIVGKMASAKGQSWKEGFGHITDIMKKRGQTHLKSVQSW